MNKNKLLNILFWFVVTAVILSGIYIRARFYLSKYPFWLDEMMLGYNFIERSVFEAFSPLDAFQKAPPLFSLVVLILRKIFGLSELVLRFLPFTAGVMSLFAFFVLLKQKIQSKAGIVAGLCLFSFCISLIYFGVEFKPYGTDVLFCILLLLLYEKISFNNLTLKKITIYTICTVLLIWSSFPCIFIIPAMIVSKAVNEKKFDFRLLLVVGGILLAGAFLYFQDINSYNYLKDYWDNVENSFSIIDPLVTFFVYMIDACRFYIYNSDIFSCILVLVTLFAGLKAFWNDRRETAVLFMLIMAVTLCASSFRIYPLKPRLTLFLSPVFILCISKIFDARIWFLKKEMLDDSITKLSVNIILSLYMLILFSVNVPYWTVSGDSLVYYNKDLVSRDKSIEDRFAVKDFCMKIMKESDNGDEVLASQEFLYGLKFYKFSQNIDKELSVVSFNDIIENKTDKSADINKISQDYLENRFLDGKTLRLWIIGRKGEEYFKCPDFKTVESAVKKYNLKYKQYANGNIWLVYVSR